MYLLNHVDSLCSVYENVTVINTTAGTITDTTDGLVTPVDATSTSSLRTKAAMATSSAILARLSSSSTSKSSETAVSSDTPISSFSSFSELFGRGQVLPVLGVVAVALVALSNRRWL